MILNVNHEEIEKYQENKGRDILNNLPHLEVPCNFSEIVSFLVKLYRFDPEVLGLQPESHVEQDQDLSKTFHVSLNI